MTVELWQCEEDRSYTLLGVPTKSRWTTMSEPGAVLRMRFEAINWDEAQRVFDRFVDHGDPGGIPLLNIPASAFALRHYPCGLVAGESVILASEYRIMEGGFCFGIFPAGTTLDVIAGDCEMPEIVWFRVKNDLGRLAKNGTIFSASEDEITGRLSRFES